MPNKYEREIEEILRNLDQSAPKPRLGQRLRRKSDARVRKQRRSLPSFNFGLSEWCLVIAWIAALIAGGWAYAHHSLFDPGTNIVTGGIAVVSAFCLLLVVVLAFLPQSRYPGQVARANNNVTRIRRSPLSSISTRWNLFLLKLRYRRRKDQ